LGEHTPLNVAGECVVLRGEAPNARIWRPRLGEPVPVAHALMRAIGVVDLRDEELAAEEILHHERCHRALPSCAILGRPL
jgi:hypothetical protein